MSFYELFIGARYLKSKKNQGFISFNTLLSIFIVFIGVFILILVTSVMNGFQSQIKDKILDIDSHITVTGYYGFNEVVGMNNYKPIVESLDSVENFSEVVPFFQGQGLFKFRYSTDIAPVVIKGMGEGSDIPSNFKKFITEGTKEFTPGKKEVYIGSEMGMKYAIRLGDKIDLIVPKGKSSAALGAMPKTGRFKVIGFFKTGYYPFDTSSIIMSLKSSQKLFSVGNRIWGVGLKVDDIYNVDKYKRKIEEMLSFEYSVYTTEERNQTLFSALRLEKLIMTIILFLVIVSAGFTIMGTLVMVVMEKRKAIGVLKSLGARPNSIMIIFILEGFFIGIIGTVIGVISGLATALNLEAIILWIESVLNKLLEAKISLIPKNIYYIDSIPTEVNPEFVVFLSIFAVFLATVSAIFPAWSAARLKPVETIRYE